MRNKLYLFMSGWRGLAGTMVLYVLGCRFSAGGQRAVLFEPCASCAIHVILLWRHVCSCSSTTPALMVFPQPVLLSSSSCLPLLYGAEPLPLNPCVSEMTQWAGRRRHGWCEPMTGQEPWNAPCLSCGVHTDVLMLVVEEPLIQVHLWRVLLRDMR